MKPAKEFKILSVRECISPTAQITSPAEAAEYWRFNIPQSSWFDPAKECVVVLILNTRRRIIGHNLVTLGGLDNCAIHPREVFRPAIVAAGSAIVLMHNHPSGDPSPSNADLIVTRSMIRAGELLKIDLLDHVIMGNNQAVSLKELGCF